MKNIFALILLCFNLALFSQEEGERYPNFPVTNLQQIGGGSGFWIVSGNVNDPAGKYDATDIDSSDVLFLVDGGNSFILPIDSVLLAASNSFQVRVLNTGITGTLSSIPTGNPAYISQTTTNYGLVPWIANLNGVENQLSQENTMAVIDSLLQIALTTGGGGGVATVNGDSGPNVVLTANEINLATPIDIADTGSNVTQIEAALNALRIHGAYKDDEEAAANSVPINGLYIIAPGSTCCTAGSLKKRTN